MQTNVKVTNAHLKASLLSLCFCLQIEGDDEQKRFEEGKSRYLQNKARRLAEKERQQ